MLRYYTQAIEIVRTGGLGTHDALRESQATLADAPELARQLAPKFGLPRFAILKKSKALSDCACAALAAERYRLKRERLPNDLAEVVAAGFLPAVPIDPYGGAPLRYRATKDGIVVSSAGPAIDGARLEFRLWNADRR